MSKLKIVLTGIAFLAAMPTIIFAQSAFAEDPFLEPQISGKVEGTGTHFEITDSEYLNISLQSAEEITIDLESTPRMISMDISSSADSISTKLTISGLEPNTTYYKYQDSYKNKAVFVSNKNGGYNWSQDLTLSHHIWIQPEKNAKNAGIQSKDIQSKDIQSTSGSDGVVFLPEECGTYGVWDEQTSTCALNKDLYESIEITANNITLDCVGHSLTGADTGYGIYLNYKTNAVIKNCTINNFHSGAYFYYGSNHSLINNNISNNKYYGIRLKRSNNASLEDNIVDSNGGSGISLHESDNNVVINNTASNHRIGIALCLCENNVLSNNTFDSNVGDGIWFDRVQDSAIFENIISNNIYGFLLWSSHKNTITNNSFINDGLFTYYSFNNVVSNNTVNSKPLIYFENISDDIIKDIEAGQVILVNCDNITVENLSLSNTYTGIQLFKTNNSNIIANNISETSFGICLVDSDNNRVLDNTIPNNQFGMHIHSSNDNVIYHNNFLENTIQAVDFYGTGNVFDNTYPSGGNYWSDYTGTDLFSGPNQDQSGSDGIGDNSYFFYYYGYKIEDRYPFMEQSGYVCGNNVCETGETFENCYQDCVEQGIEKYFPHYYFSSGEKYFPTSFYFDGDAYMPNNQENYDDWVDGFPPFYMYVHTVEDELYFTIQYWLYETFNHHGRYSDHEHDWDGIIFVVFDKSDFAQPVEVRFARHLFIGVSPWEEIEKIDNTHTLVYVAKDSHGGYPSSTMGSKDIWRSGGLKLKPNDFNWYIVENCTDKIWRIPHILPRRYCNVGPELIQGEAQPLPDILKEYEGYWPFSFPGKGKNPPAPWDDERWSQTKPVGWPDLLEYFLSFLSQADLHIYDPIGRHIGINYETGEAEIEVPDAEYSIEPDGQYILIPNPIEGDYKVEIVGQEAGIYSLSTIRNKDEEIIYCKENNNISFIEGEVHTFIQTPTSDAVPRFLKQVSVEKLEQLKNDIGALNSSNNNYDNKSFGMNNIRDTFTTAQVSRAFSIDYSEIFANRFFGARLVAGIIAFILILIIIIRIAVIQKQKRKLQDKIINIIKSKEFFQLRYTKMLCCGSIGMFFGIAHSLLVGRVLLEIPWFAGLMDFLLSMGTAMVFFYFQLKLVKGILEYFPEKKFLFYEFSFLVHFITFLFIFCPIVIPFLPIFILVGLVYGSFSLTLTSFVVPFLLVYFLFKDESKLKRFRYAFILALMIFIFWASIVGVTAFS